MVYSMKGSLLNCNTLCKNGTVSYVGISSLPILNPGFRVTLASTIKGRVVLQSLYNKESFPFSSKGLLKDSSVSKRLIITRSSSGPSESDASKDDSSEQSKIPFGYTRKDVILIGVVVTLLGFGLKSGLEFAGVDPLQAGNVVQLVLVLGLIIGWISTYIFRVSNKEMTYAQQLRDYESKVMEKRLESLTEAELEVLLEQVEEEKRSGPI
ncbi:hypothetical protein ACFE04_005288 [Oxalis oulophora]